MKKKKRGNYKQAKNKWTHRNIPVKYYTKEDVFVSRLASIMMVPKSLVKGIFSKRSVTTIRLNSLKGNVEKTKESLLTSGYDLEEVAWAKNTFFVLNKDKDEVSQNSCYADGKFYIQNLSSILPVLVLEPSKNDKVLDLCAAPGSKSTLIADLTDGKASVLANDSDRNRVGDLEGVIRQFGCNNIKATLSDGREFGKKYPVYFDKVLLDAPCSGEGLIYFNGPRPLRYWSMDKVKRCVYLQKELIVSAFKSLKHGSFMVYSTCTLEPEENEGVVTHLLNLFPNAKVEKIDLLDSDSFSGYREYIKPGIRKWSGNIYDSSVKDTVRVVPNKKMMGFYVAKISKE